LHCPTRRPFICVEFGAGKYERSPNCEADETVLRLRQMMLQTPLVLLVSLCPLLL
jgi:hypothetical protein